MTLKNPCTVEGVHIMCNGGRILTAGSEEAACTICLALNRYDTTVSLLHEMLAFINTVHEGRRFFPCTVLQKLEDAVLAQPKEVK